MSAPLIIITCIFHSVFVTLKTNFRSSIKCSPLTTTRNMDYILTLQRLPYRMNIRLYSTALWYTSKLFEIWTHDESINSTRTLSSITFTFNTYFPDEMCLVVIEFSANTNWTLDEALIYMYIVAFCELYILCCKWMCWNLMWVELCGNHFLLFLLSM